MKKVIWVTTSFEGMHCWPEAPDVVGFLRHHHRHVFHVKVSVLVSHNDRDVEFFILKDHVNLIIKNGFGSCFDLKNQSCEDMAEKIFVNLSAVRGLDNLPLYNVKSVEVSEDKENGAVVYKDE